MNNKIIIINIILLIISIFAKARPSEDERIRLWYEAGNTWPPSWHDEHPGYIQTHADREIELMQIPGRHERWENWMQETAGRLVPKFTKFGFKIIQTPKFIHDKLYNKVKEALDDFDNIKKEIKISLIYGATDPSLFVHIGSLSNEVHNDYLQLHEEWAGGIKLQPTSAYGVRLYRNLSSLVMHTDKINTHVISSIVHIAHEYDDNNEPWPIQIEDHFGNFHSVNLEEGQTLFYESAKCLHGRLKEFRGKYYGSIFLHYQPVDKNIWNFDVEDVVAAVPPHWMEGTIEDKGSRWAGQGITVDSRSPAGSPPRVINGKYIHNNKSPYSHRTKVEKVTKVIKEVENDDEDL